MNFYDTGNPYNSLAHYVNDLCGLPSTDTTFYTLAQKARATNTSKYWLALKIWKANDAWKFDDGGNTTLPQATFDLVAGQRDYTLPTSAIGIERVEIKDNAGNFRRIRQFDETDRPGALTNYGESNSFPSGFWLLARSLMLDPAPDATSVTLSGGGKIYVQRQITEFTPSTTTTAIGFDEPGDRVVALKVAEEYCGRKTKKAELEFIRFELYGGILNGKPVDGLLDIFLSQMSNRSKDMKPAFRLPATESDQME